MIGNIPERANLRRRGSVALFAAESLIVILLLSFLFEIELTHSANPSSEIHSSGWIGLDWLHSEGKFIKDSKGNIVVLRGANFMGYEFGAWASHTEEDYARMANWGFNVVRLPIAWQYIEPEPGIYNVSYFEEHVDRDIRWAEKYGIYIILDMHQWYWSPHFTFFSEAGEKGNGFPSWLVNGYPNTFEGLAKAATDFWLGVGPNGTEASYINPSMETRFMTMWKHVAVRYLAESTIAAFDVFNEPYAGTLSYRGLATFLYPFYNRLVGEIRETDSRHIILYEPTGGVATWDADFINSNDVLLSFHFYCDRDKYDGNTTMLRYKFNEYAKRLETRNAPIIVGEFNTHVDYPNSSIWLRDILRIFSEHESSWIWWTYSRSDRYAASLCFSNGTERCELTSQLRDWL